MVKYYITKLTHLSPISNSSRDLVFKIILITCVGKTVLLKIVAFFIFAGYKAAYSCKSARE
jgi:hypothetical protein